MLEASNADWFLDMPNTACGKIVLCQTKNSPKTKRQAILSMVKCQYLLLLMVCKWPSPIQSLDTLVTNTKVWWERPSIHQTLAQKLCKLLMPCWNYQMTWWMPTHHSMHQSCQNTQKEKNAFKSSVMKLSQNSWWWCVTWRRKEDSIANTSLLSACQSQTLACSVTSTSLPSTQRLSRFTPKNARIASWKAQKFLHGACKWWKFWRNQSQSWIHLHSEQR